MKIKHLFVALLTVTALWSCGDDYDDTALRNDVDDLKSRVEKLETWCTTVNGQISALQGLVTALEGRDYVTGVSPLPTNDGYTITFSKNEAITIYNGKDGANGANGITPVVGVNKDADGFYYWTVKVGDAEAKWLTDAAGKKIRTTGDAGAEPKISVAADTDGKLYWQVNGKWLMNGADKVPATGEKGETGAVGSQGDAVFAVNGVTVDKANGIVTFTLAGEGGQKFTLPMASEIVIFKEFTDFVVTSVKNELTLDLNIKLGDYTAIKAELVSSKGMTTAIVKASTRAASTPWDITLSAPTFKTDNTIDVNGKVTFAVPSDITEGEFALLKVMVIDTKGQEHAATRVIVYSSKVPVESITFDKEIYDVSLDGESTLNVIVSPANANPKTVTWTSSDESIATVDANGKVTGVKIGTATIKAVSTEDATKHATCTVTVKKKPITWATGNLVADGNGGCKIGTATDKSLYFQFGSLIGWTTSGGAASIAVKPTNCTVTSWNRNWTGDPANENAITGTGDPCKYYIKGTWRLPTKDEYVELFNDNGYPNGPWKWDATTSSAYNDDLKFQALGYSRSNDSGSLYGVGSNGYYWSSSPSGSSAGYCLVFYNAGITPGGTTMRMEGAAVRCVQEKENN